MKTIINSASALIISFALTGCGEFKAIEQQQQQSSSSEEILADLDKKRSSSQRRYQLQFETDSRGVARSYLLGRDLRGYGVRFFIDEEPRFGAINIDRRSGAFDYIAEDISQSQDDFTFIVQLRNRTVTVDATIAINYEMQEQPEPEPQPEPTPQPEPEPMPQPEPEPAPTPDPMPQPQPEPEPNPEPPAAGEAPYDLGELTNLAWTPRWPTPPNTNPGNVINVTNYAQLADAVTRSNVRIVIPGNLTLGSFSEDLVFTGDDIDISMSNSSTLNVRNLRMRAQNNRIRWIGGNVNTSPNGWWRMSEIDDLLIQDVYLRGYMFLSGRGETSNRIALVDFTLESNVSDSFSDFGWLMANANDLIYANVRGFAPNGHENGVMRAGQMNRMLVVDSAFNMDAAIGTGFRVGAGSNHLHVENTWVTGRVFHSNQEDGTNVTNARYENVSRWNGSTPTRFASHMGLANTGVVNNCQFYSNASATAGNALVLTPFTTEVGNPPIQYSPNQPDDSDFGAQR